MASASRYPEITQSAFALPIDLSTAFVGTLQVTSFPTGGTNTTLWVDVQTSYDEGNTWSDAVQFNVQSSGTWYFPFSTLSYNGGTWELDGSQWSVANQGALYQGVVGQRIRVKYGTQLGSPAGSGTFSFQVTLQPTSDLFGHGLQKPVEVCPQVSTSTGVTGIVPLPLGKTIHVNKGLLAYFKLLSVPSGGSGQTLDMYLQHSCDGGQTWSDIVHAQPTGSGPAPNIILFPVSALSPGSTTVSPITDGTLAAVTAIQGPVGDRFRIKYNANMGTGNTGPWSFYALVFPD